MSFEKDEMNGERNRLDRTLAGEEPLLPSSGFALAVMEAIAEEAKAPAPIPFPWKLAVPGFVGLAAGLVLLIRMALGSLGPATMKWSQLRESLHLPAVMDDPMFWKVQLGPLLLALAGAWCCVVLARRMAGLSSK